jgi:hypothetical protein
MAALLTNTGIAKVQNAVNGGSHTPPQHLGWGTGTTAEDPTDTDLTTPADEARVSGTKSLQTENVTDDTYRVIGTITSASSQTIAEVGLFDAAGSGTPPSGGNMYVHGVFTGIPLGIGDSIQFTVKITLAQPA